MILTPDFFDDDPQAVSQKLLGKVLRHRYEGVWLSARVIEVESYYLKEKGSHASLGYTHARRALFSAPGTIYMYYARGGDSLNFSCRGEGNAVLIKSAYPYFDEISPIQTMALMRRNNPRGKRLSPRGEGELCRGQTLLCKSLGLRVPEWNARGFDRRNFYAEDTGYVPKSILRTLRLGIPEGRDEHLPYRFIDEAYVAACCKNPLTVRRPYPYSRV